ncbi:hypothetical protein AMTRI_Chr05g60580 [Amborella trichopoda]
MSQSGETCKEGNIAFKWGKKRGVGGKQQEVQFYESFSYDGVDYHLYDCVYLYKEREPEPYIGKLIKIWEQRVQKVKKIKVLWFFRAVEILNWLDSDGAMENELFLASGEGPGLANINPLEVLVGKCNVVCTSKDNRNPQPSKEILEMADYIFYRLFDVGSCKISEDIGVKVAGIEAKFIFNREGIQKPNSISEHESHGKEGIEKTNLFSQSMPSASKPDLQFPNVVPEGASQGERTKQLSQVSSEPKSHISPKLEFDKNSVTVIAMEMAEVESNGGKGKVSEVSINEKRKLVKNASELDKRPPKMAKLDGKIDKPKPNVSSAPALDKNNTTDGRYMELMRRPDTDRSKWFRQIPWEEQMLKGHENGTLVLLENLDPSYTSTEIEEIVHTAFQENCRAKVIPLTAISSPHCGRAFVDFKTREAADMVIRRLDEGCLMLPSGRPLVASKGKHLMPRMSTKFFGHLSVEKLKFQNHREEMRKAVSTSHCSQPNTIEYEMAMEWRLLQEKSDCWWKELYKQHSEELKKLRNNLQKK